MKLDLPLLSGRNKVGPLSNWPRIIPAAHAGSPTGAGFGSSRFSSPNSYFRVLYAAADFETALTEAVIRDKLTGKLRRYLYQPHLDDRRVTQISSKSDLHLLDLTGRATYDLGIDTDVTRARDHTKGQEFSETLHDQTSFDGILYDSRLTTEGCVAIYDRAFHKLEGTDAIDLVSVAELTLIIQRRGVTVRRKRGTGR